MTIGEIAVLVVGSNGLWATITLVITRILDQKDKHSEGELLQKNTIAMLMYQAFSDKIEKILDKGYANPTDRRDIKNMYEKYKQNGWNGDMDARIKRVYSLPTKKIN